MHLPIIYLLSIHPFIIDGPSVIITVTCIYHVAVIYPPVQRYLSLQPHPHYQSLFPMPPSAQVITNLISASMDFRILDFEMESHKLWPLCLASFTLHDVVKVPPFSTCIRISLLFRAK